MIQRMILRISIVLLLLIPGIVFSQVVDRGQSALDSYFRAVRELDAGNSAEAISELSNALLIAPERYELYYCRGLAFARQNNHPSAIADFSAALTFGGKASDLVIHRAISQLAIGKSDDAMRDVEIASSDSVALGKFVIWKSMVLNAHKRHAEVVVMLEAFLEEHSPDDVRVVTLLANAYTQSKRQEKSIELLIKWSKKFEADTRLWHALYRAYDKNGQPSESLSSLRKMMLLERDALETTSLEFIQLTMSEEERRIGIEEFGKICADQPKLNLHEINESPMYSWALRRFAGVGGGVPVRWERTPPVEGFESSVSEIVDGVVRLRIRKLPNLDGVALWSRLLYECENAQNARRVEEFVRLAGAGRIDREAFSISMARLEFEASRKTRNLFLEVVEPWLREKKLPFKCDDWMCYIGPSFSEWAARSSQKDYLIPYYRSMFDTLLRRRQT